MDATAIKAMMSEIAPVIREFVAAENAPLIERNAALETRIAELEARELVLPEKGDAGEPGPQGETGAAGEVDYETLADMVRGMVDATVSKLPPAEKGDPGKDGTDVDMAEVAIRIEAAVKSAVEAIPAPKDGEPGKDGTGLADVLRDAEGSLVVVMTDGRTKSLGKIDGKDGAPGRDGLGFDDLNVEQIGERTVRFLLKRDADEAEFDVTFPVPIYRGVFKEGDVYEPGDLTTWGGSLWHLNEAKGLKPGAPDSGWQLAAKAGRPGKDAGK